MCDKWVWRVTLLYGLTIPLKCTTLLVFAKLKVFLYGCIWRCLTTSHLFQNEVNERELSALKAVIRCIEEHKLEQQYPVDPLQKRVLQLEKAKADKKRSTEAAKPLPKRPRANGVGYGPRVTNVAATDKTFYPRMTDRYPQYMYDNRQYVYPGPADNHCPPLLGSATYNLSPSHGNYFGNGYQYQAPYLH